MKLTKTMLAVSASQQYEENFDSSDLQQATIKSFMWRN